MRHCFHNLNFSPPVEVRFVDTQVFEGIRIARAHFEAFVDGSQETVADLPSPDIGCISLPILRRRTWLASGCGARKAVHVEEVEIQGAHPSLIFFGCVSSLLNV